VKREAQAQWIGDQLLDFCAVFRGYREMLESASHLVNLYREESATQFDSEQHCSGMGLAHHKQGLIR
jgi:hypothetical protein